MLKCLCNDKPKWWNIILPQIEFAINSMMNRSTDHSPFSIVYTKSPYITIDLANHTLMQKTKLLMFGPKIMFSFTMKLSLTLNV